MQLLQTERVSILFRDRKVMFNVGKGHLSLNQPGLPSLVGQQTGKRRNGHHGLTCGWKPGQGTEMTRCGCLGGT